jgi:hypothetical protein
MGDVMVLPELYIKDVRLPFEDRLQLRDKPL